MLSLAVRFCVFVWSTSTKVLSYSECLLILVNLQGRHSGGVRSAEELELELFLRTGHQSLGAAISRSRSMELGLVSMVTQ
jgi:hypothetical protein